LRFFLDFLLFLAFDPLLDSAAGAGAVEVDGVPPSLSFVSPSSLSMTSGCGVGATVAGTGAEDTFDFFFSSPSES
jgi:hypothetical protein